MKRLLLLIVIISACSFSFAQINYSTNCTTPVNNTYFQREYGTISSTMNNMSKLSYAINFANNNCLTSSQVKQITMLFYVEQDKLEFARSAYKNTFDKDNFYDVYDAFASFSTVFRLHDYVTTMRTQNNYNNPYTNPNNNNNNWNYYDYPSYIYPDHANYYGVTGCNFPMDENTFYTNYNGFKLSKATETMKTTNLKDFVNINCLTTSQVMKLASLLNFEANRLDLLKTAYLKVYDRGNFSYSDQLLPSSTYKLDLANYIKLNGGTVTNVPNNGVGNGNNNTNCSVSVTEMNDIKTSINNSSFDNSKATVAKQVLSAKKCFTVAQIKEILGLFSFESTKLEVAKYAYDFCIDKSNYYQVNDLFSFSSSKDDLTKYIQGRN